MPTIKKNKIKISAEYPPWKIQNPYGTQSKLSFLIFFLDDFLQLVIIFIIHFYLKQSSLYIVKQLFSTFSSYIFHSHNFKSGPA